MTGDRPGPHRRAWRLPDGRIVAPRRAEGPGGVIGDGMATLGPGDLGYDEWDRHLAATDSAGSAGSRAEDLSADDLSEDELAFLDAAGDDVTPQPDDGADGAEEP